MAFVGPRLAPHDILDAFLERGRRRVELQISATRLILAVLALSWDLGLASHFGPVPGNATIMRLIVNVISLVGSLLILVTLRRRPEGCPLGRIGLAATAFDVCLAVSVTLPGTFWPGESYHGYVSNLSNSILFVAAVAAGMRMSNAAARLGTLLALLGFVSAVTIDQVMWGHPAAHPYELCAGFTVLVGSCLLSLFLARRTRYLLDEGVAYLAAAQRARVAAQDTLGAYVSPEVAEKALTGSAPAPGGVRRPVAIMFSDLRGFTAYGEQLPPEQLLAELNEYLEAVVPAIRAEDGMIDKFMGDGIMIVFGATQTTRDDARRAIRTAAAMGLALEAHNLDRAARGRPPLAHGIGIHWGSAIVGNVGTAERLNHTVIGDVVNTASRLQTETKRLGVSILVSGAAVGAARAASGDGVEPLPPILAQGLIRVRGRSEEIEVFSVIDTEATRASLAERDRRDRLDDALEEAATGTSDVHVAPRDDAPASRPTPPSGRLVVVDLVPRTGQSRLG